MHTWMAREPQLNRGVFVRGVIVGDQMQGLALRNLAINQPQEPQPFLVPMPRQAGGEEGALGRQQGNLGAEYESHRRLPAASSLRHLLAFGRC